MPEMNDGLAPHPLERILVAQDADHPPAPPASPGPLSAGIFSTIHREVLLDVFLDLAIRRPPAGRRMWSRSWQPSL